MTPWYEDQGYSLPRFRIAIGFPSTGKRGKRIGLTMLYRSTDCLCRCGAVVKNLAHSASLHANEKTAPSKPGIKHLVVRGPVHGLRILERPAGLEIGGNARRPEHVAPGA
jgi:hypothetical protein